MTGIPLAMLIIYQKANVHIGSGEPGDQIVPLESSISYQKQNAPSTGGVSTPSKDGLQCYALTMHSTGQTLTHCGES
jgi:hypothetical protein